MKTLCLRLRRGEDLLESIRAFAEREDLAAAVVLSGVGCVSRVRVRDAGGANLRDIDEPCEIVSLNGTVSRTRCHLHVALSKEDPSAGISCPAALSTRPVSWYSACWTAGASVRNSTRRPATTRSFLRKRHEKYDAMLY